jgi:hypothetical protein
LAKYYRVVSEYLGKEVEFIPENMYEQVEFKDGIYKIVENNKDKIKEVCFSKTIEGCLFAINMFLKEGEYFIYQTPKTPSIDLSASDVGDFPSTEEVRYRQKVECNYFGKISISSFLIHCLQETYNDCNYLDKFDNKKARNELVRFQTIKNEIVLAKDSFK